jgi:hypothetical protein
VLVNWTKTLGTPTNRLPTETPKVHHMPRWNSYDDPKRIDVIARIAESRGHDPNIATLAVRILRGDPEVWKGKALPEVPPRDYHGQAARLLQWVQSLYYVNEPGERLQDPLYTLKVGYGDCDDLAILLYSLCLSIRLQPKLVIVGQNKRGERVRYHQGDKHYPRGVQWSHIYAAIADDPFAPRTYHYAEPTVRGAPLGWDVVNAKDFNLPELAAYGALSGSAVAGSVAGMVLDEGQAGTDSGEGKFLGLDWHNILAAALVGALVSVSSDLLLSGIKSSWKFVRAPTPNYGE